jgi:hypothetical protein
MEAKEKQKALKHEGTRGKARRPVFTKDTTLERSESQRVFESARK